MANRKKKILFMAGVIVLVIFTGMLALWLNIQSLTPRIETAVSTALGMDVRIEGKVAIAPLPGLGLSLNDVNVRNKGAAIARIEKIRVGLKLTPLARFDVQVFRIGLIKPVFSIVRANSGRFNFETPERSSWAKLFAVEKFSIARGKVVYVDERSKRKIEVDDFDLTLSNLISRGTRSVAPLKEISFTATAGCKMLKIDDLALKNLVMKAAAEKGKLDIDPLRLDIFGGTGSGSIQMDATGSHPHFRLLYALNQIRIENLLDLFSPGKAPRKSIEGVIDMSADLTAMGKSANEMKRSLAGKLALNGEHLVLNDIDIDAFIVQYERSQNFNLMDLGAFFLAGPFGPLLTKSYDFAGVYDAAQGGKGVVRKLVSVWKVEKGIAEALDVALASESQRIAMQGDLDLIDEQFVDVVVAALDKRGCAVYSENVHGPFATPRIERENIIKSMAGPVLNPMQDVWQFIQGQECTVFYSGSVAHPER
ncbi:MAG: AsmA family protein [Desulfobacterales bacterium]|nr:AsmA family protein [Desulfobacterales bacterium]